MSERRTRLLVVDASPRTRRSRLLDERTLAIHRNAEGGRRVKVPSRDRAFAGLAEVRPLDHLLVARNGRSGLPPLERGLAVWRRSEWLHEDPERSALTLLDVSASAHEAEVGRRGEKIVALRRRGAAVTGRTLTRGAELSDSTRATRATAAIVAADLTAGAVRRTRRGRVRADAREGVAGVDGVVDRVAAVLGGVGAGVGGARVGRAGISVVTVCGREAASRNIGVSALPADARVGGASVRIVAVCGGRAGRGDTPLVLEAVAVVVDEIAELRRARVGGIKTVVTVTAALGALRADRRRSFAVAVGIEIELVTRSAVPGLAVAVTVVVTRIAEGVRVG